MRISLGELSQRLGGELLGDPTREVTRIGALESADADTISFLANPRYQAKLAGSTAACVIVGPAMRDAAAARGATIVCADPHLAFARLTQWWAAQTRPAFVAGVHASAVVEPGAFVDPSAHIGALAFVGHGARIAAHAVVGAQAHVGDSAEVGAGTRLMSRAVLSAGCRIGERGIVHSGAVLGADGFGFAPAKDETGNRWEKIEQLGSVVMGDDIEIGANSCIDRGALDDTVLEDGVKIDNLVQIGHNVRIGAHSALAGCVGVAGSARIGRYCTFGGSAMILGHLEIADHVHISAATVITRSIHQPGHYTGVFPFDDNASWEKNAATLRRLHALRERLRALEKKSTP
ncbi:MAG: UDP-3-O-(3-hydroxymyristoyl)glucosamine N-acyltransferase [Chitinophagaceae bacterium]|nr:UDP-3-O-(3-hydroxymyristoyl)glucosamine N-acyltransferase [Rubrivivax sp.]